MNVMERKIDALLAKWLTATTEREALNVHKCLLIQGMRQTGKSFAIRKALSLPLEDPTVLISHPLIDGLGNITAIEVNLSINEGLKNAFEGSSSPEMILSKIKQDPLFWKADLSLSNEHRVILFIDEIQESPQAIKTLKFLSFQKYLTVIASGSLLGISVNSMDLFPTGYVEIVRLFPMDFEEVLWAKGFEKSDISSYINEIENGKPLLPALHDKLLLTYREYIISGGLPENVAIYIKEGIDSPALYLNQRSLLHSFESDIAKYAPKEERIKARQVFDAIPNALSRTNTRFTYSLLGRGQSSSRYEGALSWLINAGLIYKVQNLEEPSMPLKAKAKHNDFKLYLSDTGVLWAMLGNGNANNILDPSSTFQKGMFYENSTADILEMSKTFDERDVYYFERNSTLEVDFLIETSDKALIVEAKSSLNTKSKSVTTLMREYPDLYAAKISPKNPGKDGKLYLLPHYCLPFLDRIVK